MTVLAISKRYARRHNPNTYKSGLEVTLADQLRSAGANFLYESFRIPYTPKPKNYTPDFLLLDNGIVVEGKGYFDSADRAKHLLIQAQYPLIDIRFVFARAQNRIGKKSTTTYARWASDHGFQWAEGRIPDAWLHEPPNTASLQAIRNLCQLSAKPPRRN